MSTTNNQNNQTQKKPVIDFNNERIVRIRVQNNLNHRYQSLEQAEIETIYVKTTKTEEEITAIFNSMVSASKNKPDSLLGEFPDILAERLGTVVNASDLFSP